MKLGVLVFVAGKNADLALEEIELRKRAIVTGYPVEASARFLMATHHVQLARRAIAAAEAKMKKGRRA